MTVFKKYLYIDEEFVNDAFATLQGYDFSEQEIINEESSSKGGSGSVNVSFAKGEGTIQKENKDTVNIKAQKTTPSKIQYLIDYLHERDELPYYEGIDKDIWSLFTRDSMLEIVVDFSFTKVEEWAQIANTAKMLDALFETNKLKDNDNIDKWLEYGQQERRNGLPCILKLVNSASFPFFAYLNEDCIKGDRKMLAGQVTVLCKVARKIQPGESVELSNLVKTAVNASKSREQKKKMVQNIKSGAINDIKDTIKGPATEIIPIAIYR